MTPGQEKSARELLDFYLEAGVDALLGEQPVAASREPARQHGAAESAVTAGARDQRARLPPRRMPPRWRSARHGPDRHLARAIARAALDRFEGCALRATATQLVFADGNPQARLMLVGEAPGRDEDIEGLPFVGRSGKLLDRMLAAIGLDRTRVYIANIIPWRPPGNRTPTPQESQICLPFVRKQIELVDPDILVCLGGPSATTLLGIKEGITKSRGRWLTYDTGKREIRALATFHPAFSIAQPATKTAGLARFPGGEKSPRRKPSAIGDQHRANCDQRDAEPVGHRELFAQKHRAEQRDQHHRQLVDRRHLRRLAELERAEIAHPRRAGAEPRQQQKQIGAAGDFAGRLELPGRMNPSIRV